jgi:SAM-dependent methyltransferase
LGGAGNPSDIIDRRRCRNFINLNHNTLLRLMQTAERVSQSDASDNYVFQRSRLAYHRAARLVEGDVLEIGTGSGYGVEIIAPHARRYVTLDKHNTPRTEGNVEYMRLRVPPLPFPDGSFDAVVTFQVIEHIKKDRALIAEIWRVLRPDGVLVISTPNRTMSLTRNPWHVREYTPDEFARLLKERFASVERRGVFGRENVMRYYENNRRSVARVARLDILGMRNWLPRWILRIPYDIMNRMNRRRLLRADTSLTEGITMDDYYLDAATDGCFDLFFTARKQAAHVACDLD